MDGLPPLREVIARHNLSAKKNLGQNFLLDLNITSKIARLAGSLHDHDVVEIGPGPGGLTRALLMNGARRVIAIERDERLVEPLGDIAAHYDGKLETYFEDALSSDIFAKANEPVRVVANLPYNIGTELLIRWLTQEWPPQWASLTLMFQQEVAERITASPGEKHWGRLAVLANWRANTQIVYKLPPSAFTPPPKVNSAVVHITPTAPKVDVPLKDLERVTAAAFGQRRKMLRVALKTLAKDAEARIISAGLDPKLRGETLSIEEFGALARAFKD